MGLTRDFASLPHDRFALIENGVFPRQRPECNDDAWLAKYLETRQREWRVRLTNRIQCHAGPHRGTGRPDSDITGARSCLFAAPKNVTNGRNHGARPGADQLLTHRRWCPRAVSEIAPSSCSVASMC